MAELRENLVMRKNDYLTLKALLGTLLAVLVSTTAHSGVKLDLKGRNAPKDTEAFNEAYEDCADGLLNLDLSSGAGVAGVNLALKYRPAPLHAENGDANLRAYFTTPSYMVIERTIYRLVSLEFHMPGENMAEQGTYPLLAHFVHYGQDGSFGVLAVRVTEGAANPELDKLIAAAADDARAPGLNPRRMLPPQVDAPHYLGPEDVPACNYQLHWLFAGQPMQASAEQITRVQELLGSSGS